MHHYLLTLINGGGLCTSQRLIPTCDTLLSSADFSFNMRRYTVELEETKKPAKEKKAGGGGGPRAGGAGGAGQWVEKDSENMDPGNAMDEGDAGMGGEGGDEEVVEEEEEDEVGTLNARHVIIFL